MPVHEAVATFLCFQSSADLVGRALLCACAQEDQAELVEAAGLDPEALAALPPEMRQEVLEQEARNRRMREAPDAAPADPSRAAEMDNASFVATLPPELRREVLLTADETLLNTLPPNLVAEARVLRERNPHQVIWSPTPVYLFDTPHP